MNSLDTIGDRLKWIRERNDFNQKELAKILKTTVVTISRYEGNDRNPSIDFLSRFGKEFNISADWLLYGEGEPFRKTNTETDDGKDVVETWLELREKIKYYDKIDVTKKKLINVSLPEISVDSPWNFLTLIFYMLIDEELRKNVFYNFHISLKPRVDMKLSKEKDPFH